MSPSTQQAIQSTAITHKMSLGVTQNMIRAVISELCFARNIFPAGCFREHQVFANTRPVLGQQLRSPPPGSMVLAILAARPL